MILTPTLIDSYTPTLREAWRPKRLVKQVTMHRDKKFRNTTLMVQSPTISSDLLDLLVCPVTHRPLKHQGDHLIADVADQQGLCYPIRDGIPVLLAEEATLPDGIASLADYRQKFAATHA